MFFSLTPLRLYLTALAVISIGVLSRFQHGISSQVGALATGMMADIFLLAGLALILKSIHYLLAEKPLTEALHLFGHIALSILACILTMASSVHYLKTGEILDFRMLRFFIEHAPELGNIATSAIDESVIFLFVYFGLFFLLGFIHIGHKWIRRLQYITLSTPLLVVAINVGQESLSEDYSYEPRTTVKNDSPDFNVGVFKNPQEQDMTWVNQHINNHWQTGTLSGLVFASTSGTSLFRVLTENEPMLSLYVPPKLSTPSASESRTASIKKNVLFIILESTRASAIGIYGSENRKKTPYFDKMAAEGWLVENAYTTITHTSKALIGIYCGTFPQFTAKIVENGEGDFPLTCLPKLLDQAGYATAHFQTAQGAFENRPSLLTNVGINHQVSKENFPDDAHQYGYFALDDRLLIPPMVQWMEEQRNSGKPFFASMLTTLTHHPYVFPGFTSVLGDPEGAHHSYLQAVAYNDTTVKILIETLRKKGLLKNTLVVITGDHGQGFGEHGQFVHNGVGYEEGIKVPLAIYADDLPEKGKKFRGLHQHIDIMPTVLDLLSVPYAGKLPGISLLNDSVGHPSVLTSCFYDFYCLNLTRATGKKTLYFFEKRPVEIYNLIDDPEEQHNLAQGLRIDDIRSDLREMAVLRKAFASAYGTFGPAAN